MSRKDLNYQLKSNGNVPLDYKETPVNKVSDLEYIPMTDRFLGMTVTVLDAGDGKPADYWYVGDTLYTGKWEKKTFGEDGSNHVINGENPEEVNVTRGTGTDDVGALHVADDTLYLQKKTNSELIQNGVYINPGDVELSFIRDYENTSDLNLETGIYASEEGVEIYERRFATGKDISLKIDENSAAYSNDKFETNGAEIATTYNVHLLKRHIGKKKNNGYGGILVPSHATLQYPFVSLGDIAFITNRSPRVFMVDGDAAKKDIRRTMDDGDETNRFFLQIEMGNLRFDNAGAYGVINSFDKGTRKLYLFRDLIDEVVNRFSQYLESKSLLFDINCCSKFGRTKFIYKIENAETDNENHYIFTLPKLASTSISWGKIKIFIPLLTKGLAGNILINRGGMHSPRIYPQRSQWVAVQKHNMLYRTEAFDGDNSNVNYRDFWKPQGEIMPSSAYYQSANNGLELGNNLMRDRISLDDLAEMLSTNSYQVWMRTAPNSCHGGARYESGQDYRMLPFPRNNNFAWRQLGRNRDGRLRIKNRAMNITDKETARELIEMMFNHRRIPTFKVRNVIHGYRYIDFAVFKIIGKGSHRWNNYDSAYSTKGCADITEKTGKVYRLFEKIIDWKEDKGEFNKYLQYRGTIPYFKNRR